MSVADRMVVRIRGEYRSIARRQALALISAGRAERDDRARAAVTPAEEIEAPAVPADPDSAPTGQQDPEATTLRSTTTEPITVPASMLPALTGEPELHEVHELDAGDDDVPTVEAEPLPELPRGNAGRAAWAEYAQTVLGLTVTSDQTRNDIRDAAQEAHAAALARMPQPAVADGGRLDTPEDEPATETVADDPDTRTE
jgi:hypothetical protein